MGVVQLRSETRRRRARGPQTGFTTLELLLAAVILLVVLVSIVPLFPQAMASNLSGEESTQASIHARSSLEEGLQESFNNWQLEIVAGTELVTDEYWSRGDIHKFGDEEWLAGQPPSQGADKWTRTLTVRQFQMTGVDDVNGDNVIDLIFGLEDADEDGYFDNPLPSGSPRWAVQMKELSVRMANRRSPGVLGVPSNLTLRVIKAF